MCAECTTQRARSHPAPCRSITSRLMRMSKPTIPQTALAGTPAVNPPNYTQVPNTLIDDLMPKMKEAELKVVLAIARETFGWHRDEKSLSLTRLQALTGLSRQGVVNGIEDGLRRHAIERRTHGQSFRYRLLVNEVDRSKGQRSGPDRSTPLTSLVNEVDRQLVNEVDTAKKDGKKDLKKQETKNTHTARARVSRFDLPTCERYAATLKGLTTPDGYARSIYDGKRVGQDDGKITAWLHRTSAVTPTRDLEGEPRPDLLTALLELVSKKVNPASFKQWLAPITQLTVEGDLIRIGVPDQVSGDWISRNYYAEIEEALTEALPTTCVWRFALVPLSEGASAAVGA